MKSRLRGGKTPPRILQDLAEFDIRHPSAESLDRLVGIPYHDATNDDHYTPALGHCRHQWILKSNQSSLSVSDGTVPERGADRFTAALCFKCRSHLRVNIRYATNVNLSAVCPTTSCPLHHFLYCADALEQSCTTPPKQDSTGHGEVGDTRYFRCSSLGCLASLVIESRLPLLTTHWVSLLTDRLLIKSRVEKQICKDPKKFEGHAAPLPGTVIENLYKLINISLENDKRKPYPWNGRNYQINFGEPCDDLLRFLGFVLEDGFWLWPTFSAAESMPFEDHERKKLDDVRAELDILMMQRPVDEKRQVNFTFSQITALPEMEATLGCATHKQKPNQATVDLTTHEHPCYAGLGAIADFDDNLLYFAYSRQIQTDPMNGPYYLECLQTIADGRASEFLITKAVIEQSEGRLSLRDVRNAYRGLGLNMTDTKVADDVIIGTFQARLADAPKQESILRQELRIIGQHRESQKIINSAVQGVSTYEQALTFLDANETMSDEFITTMYMLKVDGSPSEENLAREAVLLIAMRRKSERLRQWLNTGILGSVGMDLDQAYSRLGISNQKVEDDVVWTIYRMHIEDQPAQVEELNQAFQIIVDDRKSDILKSYAEIDTNTNEIPLDSWPVALNNIGNTCYLNSLLQFYFSLRPFRELMLNVEDHKMLAIDDINDKKVGSRLVSKREIIRAQHTVDALKKLFIGLITCSTRSFRPETEVARLTLVTAKAETIRRQSTTQAGRSNSEIMLLNNMKKDLDCDDKLGTKPRIANNQDQTITGKPTTASPPSMTDSTIITTPGSSTDTLVNLNEVMAIESNKRSDIHMPSSLDGVLETQLDADSMKDASTIDLDLAMAGTSSDQKDSPLEINLESKPSKPPAVPPRPTALSVDGDQDALKEVEFAAEQQDVSEIKDNILFQIECAIKAEAVDAQGEQIDIIKRLFYGKQMSHITDSLGVVRSQEEWMSDIKVNVLKGPCDIYAALDGAFDVEDVNIAGKTETRYYTISQLPQVLQIHVQRAQYDPVTKQPFKSENHLQLRSTLYMDRYLDTADTAIIKRRHDAWKLKTQLSKLEIRREQLTAKSANLNVPELLDIAIAYLSNLGELGGPHAIVVPDTLEDSLKRAARDAKAELQLLHARISELNAQLERHFDDLQLHPYRLAAVFVHRGSSSAGHYWIYIYDFKSNLWRNYNDELVTAVEEVQEIFNAPVGPRPPTPYFLVYVKDEDLVDPVCRDIKLDVETAASQLLDPVQSVGKSDAIAPVPHVSEGEKGVKVTELLVQEASEQEEL